MAEDTKNTVITMRQSEALAAQRNGNTVEAAQKAVDAAQEALDTAKAALVQAKADAKALGGTKATPTDESGAGGTEGAFLPELDPGKFTVVQIGEWARGTSDVDALKKVQKAEAKDKARAGVDAALQARLDAIKAAAGQ